MRGIAGNKAKAVAIAFGDQFTPHPRHHTQNFELEVATDGAAEAGQPA